MSETKTYLFHELSSIFPLIEGDEFNGLVDDMREKGQLDEGVLFEGKILDGRNRYRVCKILKIPFKCREYSEDLSALDYIISTNLHRRHLNIAQRSEIGLILLKEEEKKAEERVLVMQSIKSKMANKNIPELKKNNLGDELKKIKKGRSVEIVAPKVKVATVTLSRAKKIKKIAETQPYIKEQWEEAKRETTSIGAVYRKAQVMELIDTLPESQRKVITEKLMKGESIDQIKQDIQDLKDNIKRAEIAKRNRAMEKKKVEKEKLHLKINEINKNIYELENAFKSSEATLNILSNETVGKYPHIESKDSAFVLTHLGVYYDTLDMEIYDEKLKELRSEYDVLEKPLRDKLAILESEYTSKKSVIDKQKKKKNVEVSWIEKQQTLMVNEFDKQVLFKGRVEKLKKEVAILQEKYGDS